MREAVNKLAAIPSASIRFFPVELVIDHSVQVDSFGAANSFDLNAQLEFQRNVERYAFLRWGQTSFQKFQKPFLRAPAFAISESRISRTRRLRHAFRQSRRSLS